MNSYPTLRTSRAERWLWGELGDVPGALLMIILWTAVAVSTLNLPVVYIPFLTSVFNEAGVQPPPPDMLSPVVLPLALVTAVLHTLTNSRRQLPWNRQAAIIGGTLAVALGLALSAGDLLTLDRLPGLHLPQTVIRLKQVAWPALTLLGTLSLAVSRRHRLSPCWAALLAGSVTGVAAILSLAYPVYTLTYTLFIAGTVYTGVIHYLIVLVTGLLGIGLIAAAGPLAVHWNRTRGRARLGVGTLAGVVVGACLFGGLGGPAAGLIAQAPLYGVALDRTGYSSGEWVLELALAIINTFPLTYAAFWALLGGGAVVGGLTGRLNLLTRSSRSAGPIHAVSRPILWPVVGLLSTLLLLLAMTDVAILLLLEGVLQNILDLYGYTPAWLPTLITFTAAGQPWLVYLALQAGTLYWLHRHSLRLTAYPSVHWLTFGNGILNLIVLPGLLYLMNQSILFNLWSLAPLLTMMLFGLEMIVVSWPVGQSPPANKTSGALRPYAWATTGLVGALLAALFIHQSVAMLGLNLAFLALAPIEVLLQETAPPPGLSWLDNLIAPLFALHLAALVSLAVVLTLAGVILSGGLRLLDGRWRAWISPNLKALGWGSLAWLLTVLAGSAVLVALTWWQSGDVTRRQFMFLLYVGLTGLFLLVRRWRWGWVFVLPAVGLGAVALYAWVGYDIPDFLRTVAGPYPLLFVGGLLLSQHQLIASPLWGGRGAARLPSPRLVMPLRIVGWGLLAAAIGELLGGPRPVPYVVGLALVAGASQRSIVDYLAWPNLALAFGLALAGLIGLTLDDSYQLLLGHRWLWFSYLLLFGLTAGISYQALNLYAPTALRLAALPVLVGLVWLMLRLDQSPLVPQGGVSRYDPDSQQWTQLTPTNSPLGGALAYRFFEDSRGRLWAGSGTGLVARPTGQRQRAYLLFDTPQLWAAWLEPRTGLMAEPLRLLEDSQGQLWAASSIALGRFDPARPEDHLQLVASDKALTKQGPATSPRPLPARLVDVVLDPAGRLWLATAGQGVLRLDTADRRQPRWQAFTQKNSKLPSNQVHTLAVDQAGAIWAGTAQGLSRFNGTTWETLAAPEGLANSPVSLLLVDSRQQLWVGTDRALFRWDGQAWTSFDVASGWPEATGPTVLFEDSRGQMWAGTLAGAWRLNGQQWSYPVPDLRVTTLAEGPAGIIWLGGRQGLVRYDPATREQTHFTAAGGTLAANWVRDLHVDRAGSLWVSTFATQEITPPLRWGLWAMVLFFGCLFVSTYRGYVCGRVI